MQTFDSLLITCLLLVIALNSGERATQSSWRFYSPILVLTLVLIQLVVEGYRWQMVPTYFVLCALQLVFLKAVLLDKRREKVETGHHAKWRKWSSIALRSSAATLVFSSVLASYFFPVFTIPEPSGEYAVGTTELHLRDDSRLEIYTSVPDDKRELMVRVWYPADVETTQSLKPVPYWRNAAFRGEILSKGLGLPFFTFQHLNRVSTNSFWQVPLSSAQSQYPVLVYSHAFEKGWASQNTHLVEALASHGYIVFGIEHAHVGAATVFPDGRQVAFNEEKLGNMPQEVIDEIVAIFYEVSITPDWRRQVELMQDINEVSTITVGKNEALRVYEADQSFVISTIEQLNQGDKTVQLNQNNGQLVFNERIDISRLGIFGMSFGGSSSLGFCVKDSRCKAGINMDGIIVEQIELPPLERPFMFINSAGFEFYNAIYSKAKADAYSVTVGGSAHFNHLDFSIMSPLYKMLRVLGPIEGYHMLNITEDYVRAFFDKYLKGKDSPLLSKDSDKYIEVTYLHKKKSDQMKLANTSTSNQPPLMIDKNGLRQHK